MLEMRRNFLIMAATILYWQVCYRPQTKFAKVMFLQVSVCPHRGGRAWFYSAWGGVRGFIWGGLAWFYSGGCAWFYLGGGMCGFFSFSGYNEIRSMGGWYASYWNAFLFILNLKPHPETKGRQTPPHCGQTDTCENITFSNIVRGR